MSKKILLLHNIRSVHNVGSLFRTSDCCGIDKIILTGYSPTPKDRFGNDRKDFIKASLGAEKFINWEYKKQISPIINKLKREGAYIAMIEQSKNSIDYKKLKLPKNRDVCFVLGNEVKGVSKALLEKADAVVEIPMKGEKESLNVSVAGGVALFRMLNV